MTHTTKASLRRAMKAAKKEGLRVRRSVGVLSDTTPLTLAEVADRLRVAGQDCERSVRRLFDRHGINILRPNHRTFLVTERQYAALLEAMTCSPSESAAKSITSGARSVLVVRRESSKNILREQIAATMQTRTDRSLRPKSGMNSFTVLEGGRKA
jgi:hypothetical protein